MNLEEKEILLARLKNAQLELQYAIDAVNLSSTSIGWNFLDSNGEEIKVGGTVYGCSDGKKWEVIGFTTGAYPVMVEDENGTRRDLKAKWITQEKPNTQMDVEMLIESNIINLVASGSYVKYVSAEVVKDVKYVSAEVVKDALAMQREVTTRKCTKQHSCKYI